MIHLRQSIRRLAPISPSTLHHSRCLSSMPPLFMTDTKSSPLPKPNLIHNQLSLLQIHKRGFHGTKTLLDAEDKKKEAVSVVKRFKQMFKDYWYVLVPVHCVTSVFWFGGFYVMCKSGVDVPAVLEYLGASEAYLEKLRSSDLGYYALAYACYKVATPARYTVTIGGTTLTIKYLSQMGILKTTSEVADNIRDKRDELKDKLEDEWREGWEKFAKKRSKKDDKS